MKQTAVEFAVEKLAKFIPSGNQLVIHIILEEAKELEKKQIIEACYFAYNEGCSYMADGKTEFESFEQYYDETFKNK